ncbi:MAG TPA: hypothetical protein VGK30_09555 [Candidatus Binatia bacterium]
MRTLVLAAIAAIVFAVLTPSGCQRMQQRMLLSLVRESERDVDVLAADPPSFRFPPTPVRVVAIIDYDDARRPDSHVSFVPPDGSAQYAFAASVCDSWAPACMESATPAVVDTVTYGTEPPGLRRLEPVGGSPAPLRPNHLYGLALLGDKLFALKVFYRDDAGALHLMDGSRFAQAIVQNRRDLVASFLAGG